MNFKKFRSLSLILITIFAMTIMIGTKQSKAATNEKYIGVIEDRYTDESQENTIGYSIGIPGAGGEKIIDVVTYSDEAGHNISSEGNYYCAKAGVGFRNGTVKKYDLKYNLIEDKDEILNSSKAHLEGIKENYYKLLALSDLLYLEESNDEETIRRYEQQIGINLDEYETYLTKNDIEAVQQAAIWYFTNNDENLYTDIYNGIVNGDTSAWLYKRENGEESYSALNNRWNGELDRKQQADELFVYLIDKANENAEKYKSIEEGGEGLVPNRDITLYLTNINDEDTQPVILIEKNFDLTLRKFITTINGNMSSTSREPQVDTSKLNRMINGKIETTAIYNHPKNQIKVSTGDTIIYTLRVYNEGSSDGYAGKIIDYLPEGLDFVKLVDADGKYTAKTSTDGRTLEITNVEKKAIPSYLTTLQYEDVQVECKVSKENDNNPIVLTNIAEIAEYVDGENIVNKDRDSEPYNFPDDKKTNNYAGNGTNGTDLNYILGQQDDDDFEPIILEKAKGNYNLQIIKVDKENNTEKIDEAKFLIKVNDEEAKEISTSNGVADFGTIDITQIGTDNITIEETQAPNGYNKLIGTITLKATKGLRNGAYKVIEKSIVGQTNNSVTSELNGDTITVTIQNKKKTFDLALRKFITEKNGSSIETSREPAITDADKTALANGDTNNTFDGTTAYKKHTKTPLTIATGDKITYTIRIYNEGEVDGTAKTIADYLPEGLELVPASESTINATYGWTADESDSKKITTNYLNNKNIVAFDGTTLNSEEVKVECKVTATAGENDINLINVAEITESNNQFNYLDRDSKENNLTEEQKNNYNPGTSTQGKGYEDDDDFEPILLPKVEEVKTFDLALRKFATSKNGTEITPNRGPVINETELAALKNNSATFDNGTTAEKGHTKSALKVVTGDKIVYTIRVYNEGDIDGQATEITDYLPEGLELVPSSESEINSQYGWEQTENNGIKTSFLAGKTISGFNGSELKYLDVQVECKVSATISTNKQSLKNVAEITKSTNEYGYEDRDSTPNNVEQKGDNYNPGTSERGKGYEDDDDCENLIIEDATGSYKIQLYKQDQNGNTIRMAEAKFNVNGEEKTTTNGELIIDHINITSEGIDTYTIQETEAPTGYKKIANTITLNVTKTLNEEKNGYIAVGSLVGADENVTFENSDNTITIKVKNIAKIFDLALRKYITKIDGVALNGTSSRTPQIGYDSLISGTTATYNHRKDAVTVKKGSVVTYNLTVYNEGEKAGRATKIVDQLPTGLQYSKINTTGFTAEYDEVTNTITIKKDENNKTNLEGYTENNLKSETIEIECIVTEKPDTKNKKVLTNVAWIAAAKEEGTEATIPEGTDRDSQPSTAPNVNKDNMSDYKGTTTETDLSKNQYYPGQQDDDDFEKLVIEPIPFDLSLRKFITQVENQDITNRIPQVSYNQSTNKITYNHSKEPVEVKNGNTVIYTIRVYNEGEVSGFASEVSDDIPEGLEFIPQNDTNKEYRWIMYDKDGKQTTDIKKAVRIKTDYLSKQQGEARMEKDNSLKENPALLTAFDSSKGITDNNPDFADVKVAFKVIEPSKSNKIVINSAQISDDTDENGNPIDDKDSEPDKWNEGEDDQDQEFIKLTYFDLALRKYITNINSKEITNRIPQVNYDKTNNTITYNHAKEPVEVTTNDTIIYTIRVFNEGNIDGYASEISDDLPEGLEYLPENAMNKEYRWIMYDKDGKETNNVKNAVRIKTDYLSKEQGETRINGDNQAENPALLKAFDSSKGITADNPDYADVKVAFKVIEPATSDRIVINSAQISNDTDKDGNPIDDDDSEPDKWNEGEDDQDQEKIKLTYFDLALRKWTTQAIVIENGKQTITETGNKAEDTQKGIVKVELNNKRINDVIVKFRYSIRITNEGKIAGYAKEITDYVPQGLKFVAEDNEGWTDKGNNVITTRLLENTLLQPGESAEVTVVLTWINGGDNLGLKTNIAEISEDYNEKGIPDIDSKPNNQVPGEDDIDNAPVLLSILTGKIKLYATLGLIILVTIGSGVVLIKRFVL